MGQVLQTCAILFRFLANRVSTHGSRKDNEINYLDRQQYLGGKRTGQMKGWNPSHFIDKIKQIFRYIHVRTAVVWRVREKR